MSDIGAIVDNPTFKIINPTEIPTATDLWFAGWDNLNKAERSNYISYHPESLLPVDILNE
ncbi:MAG: hypothetical protein JW841_16125 [Deltaproteobacteria bacterium]|nr:hypothetical protein [Deltaproteobacteria bacterium]